MQMASAVRTGPYRIPHGPDIGGFCRAKEPGRPLVAGLRDPAHKKTPGDGAPGVE
jgi:hypothetical protein